MKQTLTQRVEALEKRLDNKCKGWHIFTMGASKCDRCGIENPSYTAMRSTGDQFNGADEMVYCECPTPTKIDTTNVTVMPCYKCGRKIKPQEDVRSTEYCECSAGRYKDNNTCAECNKPIKPQEDIREKIGKIINEYWGNGYQIGKHGAFSAKTMETDTVVDRILAIVKGE